MSADVGSARGIVSHEYSSARRQEEAKRWYANVVGAVGEYAVAKLTGQVWHADLHVQRRDEPDVGDLVQVRALAGHHYKLKVHEDDYPYHQYVLVTGDPPVMWVRGWCWGWEAQRHLEWWGDMADWDKPAFWVPQKDLWPMDTLEEFADEHRQRVGLVAAQSVGQGRPHGSAMGLQPDERQSDQSGDFRLVAGQGQSRQG
jgi:hypothetical protein